MIHIGYELALLFFIYSFFGWVFETVVAAVKKKQFVNRFETGESMLQLCQRIYNLLDEVCAQENQTYLLVAHNGIARAVRSYFLDMPNDAYSAYGIRNCELCRYDF